MSGGAGSASDSGGKRPELPFEWCIVVEINTKKEKEEAKKQEQLLALTAYLESAGVEWVKVDKHKPTRLVTSLFLRLSEAAVARVLKRYKWIENNINGVVNPNPNQFTSAEHAFEIGELLETKKLANEGVDTRFLFSGSFPLQGRQEARSLLRTIALSPVITKSTLDRLHRAFGAEIAFYFAWLDFYNRLLLPPSILGLLMYFAKWLLLDADTYEILYQQFMPIYGIMIIIWGTVFVTMWARRQSEFSVLWGARTLEIEDKSNPNFDPNKATGNTRFLVYLLVLLIFGVQASFLVLATFGLYILTVYLFFTFPNCNELNTEDCQSRFYFVDCGTTVLYIVFIAVADYAAVGLLARRLTRLENHETLENHNRMLAHKIFSFYFLDGFMWYILLAFVQIPLTGSATMNQVLEDYLGLDIHDLSITNPLAFRELTSQTFWMNYLSSVIVGYFTASQFIPPFIESGIPYLLRKFSELRGRRKLKRMRAKGKYSEMQDEDDDDEGEESEEEGEVVLKKSASKSAMLPHWERLIHVHTAGYDVNDPLTFEEEPADLKKKDAKRRKKILAKVKRNEEGYSWRKLRTEANLEPFALIDDYEDLILEFGYVLAFSVMWPFISVLALLNNMLEARADFFRLCKANRRPPPLPVKGIGVYQTHLRVTTQVTVVMTLGLCLVATHNMDVYFVFFKGTSYEDIVFSVDPVTHTEHLSIMTRFLIAVLVEHLILLLQRAVEAMIPPQPEWVKAELHTARSKMALMIRAAETHTNRADNSDL